MVYTSDDDIKLNNDDIYLFASPDQAIITSGVHHILIGVPEYRRYPYISEMAAGANIKVEVGTLFVLQLTAAEEIVQRPLLSSIKTGTDYLSQIDADTNQVKNSTAAITSIAAQQDGIDSSHTFDSGMMNKGVWRRDDVLVANNKTFIRGLAPTGDRQWFLKSLVFFTDFLTLTQVYTFEFTSIPTGTVFAKFSITGERQAETLNMNIVCPDVNEDYSVKVIGNDVEHVWIVIKGGQD